MVKGQDSDGWLQLEGGRSEEQVDPWDDQNDLIDDDSMEAVEFNLNVRTLH